MGSGTNSGVHSLIIQAVVAFVSDVAHDQVVKQDLVQHFAIRQKLGDDLVPDLPAGLGPHETLLHTTIFEIHEPTTTSEVERVVVVPTLQIVLALCGNLLVCAAPASTGQPRRDGLASCHAMDARFLYLRGLLCGLGLGGGAISRSLLGVDTYSLLGSARSSHMPVDTGP